MKKVSFILSLTYLILACDGREETQVKTIEIRDFTIDLPPSWSYEEGQGYDSFVGTIRMSAEETATFDLGRYSNKLNVDAGTHHIITETIDGKRAKIVSPKSFRHGTTGIYFDSLETSRVTKFQLSGTDLSEQNSDRLLEAIRTLKFH